MPELHFANLLFVTLIALLAPLLLGLAPVLRVPAVVLEIVIGIVVGPYGLGLVEVDLPVQIVALLGLGFQLFLAGLEVDVHRLRGQVLRLAVLGYLVTLAIGGLAGWGFSAAGWVHDPFLLTVTLSATSLGLVVLVLKDAGKVEGEVGQSTIATASVAEFAAVLVLSLVFSGEGGSTGERLVMLALFALLVAVTGMAVLTAGRSRWIEATLFRLQDTTAQIRVRASVVLLVAFVVLAERFGLETILGAFLAGGMVGLVDRDSSTHPQFRVKLAAIGYGFLIPVFFVTSGLRLDLGGLLDDPAALLRVPLFLLALLAARGVPALLWVRRLGARPTAAMALLQATSLPFIVAASQIGVATGLMSSVTSAALVCAGLLSVLLFPALALVLLKRVDGGRQ
jgi:Kef-type K+ transport system membrane component KefB